jgi:apolipoprotein N-acyltransferase
LDAVEPGPTVTVAAVQGDIDQSRKWDVDYRSVQVERYVHLTGWAVDRGARLVVWPETAAPYYFGHEPALDAAMVRLATENDLLLLFGAPAMGREAVSGKPVSYNRAWLVDPAGNATFYDKVRLAPFGEYVPFTDLLFFIRALAAPIGDIHPGEALAPMTGGEWSVGAQICFEAIFPQYSRRLTADGAQVLAIITNDSWFGRTPSSRQALAMGVLRGVENRIPVVRAAQSGVSAIVTAEGRILQATDLFTVAVAMGDIVPRPSGAPLTFYTLTGDLFRWLCVVMALVPFALPRRFGRRP